MRQRLSVTAFSNDHYMHVAGGQQISMGAWPVRDYVELITLAFNQGLAVGRDRETGWLCYR
jgi:hypothetical protein